VKQINFLVLFLFTMALVLFALENTATATIQIIPGTVFEAPLCVELIAAMGIGAAIAWLFSIWTGMQNAFSTLGKNKQIQNLKRQVTELSVQMEDRSKILSSSPHSTAVIDVESEDKTKA
jgi:lipopolysaccharide assembly protein A